MAAQEQPIQQLQPQARKSPVEMLKLLIAELPKMIKLPKVKKSQFHQVPTQEPNQSVTVQAPAQPAVQRPAGLLKISPKLPKVDIPPEAKKIFIVGIVLIVILLIIAKLLPIIMGLITPAPSPTPESTPLPTPEIAPREPSPYSQDEEVLAIEEAIKSLEDEMKDVGFKEDILRVPDLDWNIKFDK